ncbi:acyltransferase family protein [Aspergillus saccharolyticus JOP 1030-1]|uniref:Acyltransferase 3 domain-containing protein n=1 Tax=Aspergillus saccharolyticus JOP 1030-1 TaxID=1450539 RepID=A0A318ZJ59_9EURO|nr:hypothetical protein BP01DRAFT_92472 [Aspergillus saccharolyticus JOP 1030-1]PYH43750.1 hypothetical protein BP01DRAFT_92472 [Aspergillus saccharolyticus JOP 1030-1]
MTGHDRIRWLDGLRGIAAAIVAFDHYFMSDVWHPFVSFWADPPEANRHWVQLPPVRILFSAHSMVTLFMVISGFAISVSLLKARHSPQFLPRVTSAMVRRLFRIYLPVVVLATLSQFLFFFDLYHWEFDDGFLDGLQPWTDPWAHIQWLCGYMADSMNVIAFEYRGGLNGQLWTMPLEFRGSNVVYLLTIGLSAWRPKLRLWALPLLAGFFLWAGNWDIFGFIWGLWLAERTIGSAPRMDTSPENDCDDEEKWPRHRCAATRCRLRSARRKLFTLSRLLTVIAFTIGVYLLCLGSDGQLPPGYQFLACLHPAKWKDRWDIYQWCWKSVGAACLVYAIAQSPLLQSPLHTRPVQYLGKISFSLYLLHETIYQLWRNPLRDLVYLMASGHPYVTSAEALRADAFAFHVAWWVSGIILGTVVLFASHYYTIYVDNKCVALAKRLERWVTS